jgi:hypothetical protein
MVPFSCFSRLDSCSAVLRASGPIFKFCAPELVFGGTEGVPFRFHVLRSRTRFRRFGGCRVPFSCFARPYTFSSVPRASGPVFMFCAPGLVFGGTVGVGSRCHVLRALTRFRRYRGLPFPSSRFTLPDSSSALSRGSGFVFMFCAPVLVFMLCTPGLILGGFVTTLNWHEVLTKKTLESRETQNTKKIVHFIIWSQKFESPKSEPLWESYAQNTDPVRICTESCCFVN